MKEIFKNFWQAVVNALRRLVGKGEAKVVAQVNSATDKVNTVAQDEVALDAQAAEKAKTINPDGSPIKS